MGVQPWATVDDLPSTRPTLGGDEEWQRVLAVASEVLYGLTGRTLGGIRERAVELYAPPASCAADPCRVRPSVRLPNRPVVELLAVRTATGAPLPTGDYRVARGGYLEAAHGRRVLLPSAASPLRVRYRFGRDPGDAGRLCAATYATALGQAIVDPDSSPLPSTIVQIVRQGITMTQQAASTLIAQGMTGLGPVDSWVATVNPTRQRRPGRAWSPDTDAPYYPLDLEEVPVP